ncbi:hypothetical protein ACQKRQ_22995 [Paraburkholderia sp. NPDC080076]|uniref:hypothetical protein n=1 Tax=Paraburkholderia sp. NPDC080076 TaxID=3390605 RepID=UPI003CFBDEB3
MAQYIDVEIGQLILDNANPRIGSQTSQQDAILAIIADQGDKLVNMARDVVKNGLSPAVPFIVTKQKKGSHVYIALEGNRRLAAIKLVRAPELAVDTAVHKKFLDLHRSHLDKIPTHATCVELPTRTEANIWIQRLHDRGLNGAGVEGWSSEAKSRFQADTGGGPLTLEQQLIDAVRKLDTLTDDDREAISGKVAGTTIRRILDDKSIREALGYDIVDDELVITTSDTSRVIAALAHIVLQVARKEVKVGAVYDKDSRKEYLENRIPDDLKRQPSETNRKKPTNAIDALQGSPTQPAKPKLIPPKKPTTSLKVNRNRLVPNGVALNVTNAKAKYLFDSLKKLNVEDQPLLLVLGLRSFIEISCFEFQRRRKLAGATGNMELHNRIDICVTELEKLGVTANELKGARVCAKSDKDHVHSTATVNAYVHNPHFIPRPKDVTSLWDNLQPFLLGLWAN